MAGSPGKQSSCVVWISALLRLAALRAFRLVAPVTAKEGDSEEGNEAFGANIHLAVGRSDHGAPFVSGRMRRREPERGAENGINLWNPDQEFLPIPPERRQPP